MHTKTAFMLIVPVALIFKEIYFIYNLPVCIDLLLNLKGSDAFNLMLLQVFLDSRLCSRRQAALDTRTTAG